MNFLKGHLNMNAPISWAFPVITFGLMQQQSHFLRNPIHLINHVLWQVFTKCSSISSQFAGSQGRPDSRGPPLVEVHEPPSHQPPVLKASLGPVISNGSSVAPRIRQLQMQLSTTNPTINPTCAPRGSLV